MVAPAPQFQPSIVERLRSFHHATFFYEDAQEAADRIEFLEGQVEGLTESFSSIAEVANTVPALKARVIELETALRFYADPFAWKKKHDPENDVRVPDFYSETSFGDTAIAALPKQKPK